MVEPPHKRSRRSDQDVDRRRESPDRNARDSRDRGVKEDRGGRNHYDRDSRKERDKRYRSRSPERDRDRNRDRDRDRDRERRNGPGHDRGGRDELRDRDRERDQELAGGDRRDDGRDRNYRDSRRDVGGGRGRGGRDRKRPREDDYDSRASRSRSPARDVRAYLNAEDMLTPSKSLDIDAPRGPKSRTATPPVAFKVGTGGQGHPRTGHPNGFDHKVSPGHSRGQTPIAHDSEAMDTDVAFHDETAILKLKGKAGTQTKIEEKSVEEDEDIVVEEDDSIAAMQAMLGFGGFGTTKQKKVVGNDVYAVRKEKKTEYRQYMNRVGGFNRPLSPSRD